MRPTALTDAAAQSTWPPLGRQAAAVVILAAATGLAAHVRLPLPFTPVPITLQTLMVLVAGGLLGMRLGTAAQMAYLLLAALGLPLIAGPTLFGPTGGYLIGFVLAAALMGYAAGRQTWPSLLAGAFAATVVIWACGVGWLCLVTGQSLRAGLALGLAPFLPGDILKTLAALAIIRAGRPRVTRFLNP